MENKKIVILGGGYGGIAAAKECEKLFKHTDGIECMIIEKNKYHTLMTQLHEMAGGRVLPTDVRIPYHKIFAKKKKAIIRLFHEKIVDIDFHTKKVFTNKDSYNFDFLIIATGSRPEFFGIKGAEKNAHKLWGLAEAVAIKEHVEDSFHLACRANTFSERKRLLTFVVAGGGFTGVELAGELTYLCKNLAKKYGIKSEEVSIYLVEAAPKILGIMDKKQIKTAMKYLEKIGVKVLTNTKIEEVDDKKIFFANGKAIECSLLWSAGIKGNPYIQSVNINTDNRLRIVTNEFLQANSYKNVFCAGDAVSYGLDNQQVPQVVENALQSGKLAAKNIYALIRNEKMKAYFPKFHGSMISIGPIYGVAKLGNLRIKWLFATMLKHLVNIHYHFEVAGIPAVAAYINAQFLKGKW